MVGQELRILFQDDKAYLCRNKPLSFAQLGLPPIAKSFKAPASWSIQVLRITDSSTKLYCSIHAYHVGAASFKNDQLLLSEQLEAIENITFNSIDTAGLLKTLSGSVPFTYKPHLFAPGKKKEEEQLPHTPPENDSLGQFLPIQSPLPESKEKLPRERRRQIRETFQVAFKDITFKFGGVSFKKNIKGFPKAIEFLIYNEEIREEFDAVKNYFSNVLKTKKIDVSTTIQIINDEIQSIEVHSPQIELINKALIDNVKFEFVKKTTHKKTSLEINKSLFTMDEYFEQFAENKFKSNTFFKNEEDLLNDLLEITQTKHYKHLRYLSSIHASHIMKLRFVHKPFSFIFLIEGNRNYHIIWETLDTREATYVWHVRKEIQELKRCLQKIEDIIHVIKVQGKTAYISSAEDPFRRIYHDYSEVIDGFIKWKGELESILS
jgi:hypothetical protein